MAWLAAAENRIDLLVEDRDVAVEITEQIVQFSDCLPRQRRQCVLQIRQDPRNQPPGAGNALGNGEASIEQETSDLADHGGAMIDHALARAMQGLDILLLDRLLRDERNVRLACGGADRLSVVAVVLPPAQ